MVLCPFINQNNYIFSKYIIIMSLNQSVRFGKYDKNDYINPHKIYESLKPMRILSGVVNPGLEDGTLYDYYINTSTADFFTKDGAGAWSVVYNFNTGAGNPGITAIENETPGFFKNIIGATAHFKGLAPDVANEIFVNHADPDTILLSIENTYKPLTLSNVDNIKIGGDTFPPNSTFDENNGFNVGSLWTQTPNGSLYSCVNNDNGSAQWVRVGPYSGSNVGFGAGQVLKGLNGNDFEFRTITATTNQTKVLNGVNNVTIAMEDAYKPVSLNKVDNVKNNFNGNLSPPTINDGVAFGYQSGSLWSSGTDLYICDDPTLGAAVWSIVGDTIPAIYLKDVCMFKAPGVNQSTTFGATLIKEKLNIDLNLTELTARGSWAGTSAGFGAVISRVAPTNGQNNNKYLVNYTLHLKEAGNSPNLRLYTVGFIKGNGANTADPFIDGSFCGVNFNPLSTNVSLSSSFIYDSTTSTNESIYPAIFATTTTDTIFLESFICNITEI